MCLEALEKKIKLEKKVADISSASGESKETNEYWSEV